MGLVAYDFNFNVNSDLAFSAKDLSDVYLFGIDFRDDAGRAYGDREKELHIRNAQKEMEGYLDIKLSKQIIEEDISFDLDHFRAWGYIRASYPIAKPIFLKGFINTTKQIEYPASWLSNRETNDEIGYERNLHIVPAGAQAVETNNIIYSGVSPTVGFFGNRTVPNYWKVRYCTGFTQVPSDILDAIGKLAAINVLNILGDIAIGAGIASQSIGIDGLSQSISTTQSAENNALSARVRMYTNELKEGLPKLKDRYKGYGFAAM